MLECIIEQIWKVQSAAQQQNSAVGLAAVPCAALQVPFSGSGSGAR